MQDNLLNFYILLYKMHNSIDIIYKKQLIFSLEGWSIVLEYAADFRQYLR